ncbi:magnesium transporter CorA family protein, partial [Levilactobacillus brevis]
SIVLTIPTMVYGLWGINVPVPFAKSDAGILAVVIISFILSVVVWLWLRRRKYL